MNSNLFTGPIPTTLGGLSALKYLIVSCIPRALIKRNLHLGIKFLKRLFKLILYLRVIESCFHVNDCADLAEFAYGYHSFEPRVSAKAVTAGARR